MRQLYIRPMNQTIEKWVLGSIVAAFGVYVVLRAWWLPVTVDESATALNHVPRVLFDTLLFKKEANPNNHILNTVLIKICTGIFGWHHFVLRIPVLIGAFLYAWASLHLVRKIVDNAWLRAFGLLLLFGNPFLLEFFSLARGYGLAVGLMTAALWFAWCFLESNNPKKLRLAMIFGGLAVYANFTLLIFFAPFSCMLLLASWQLNPTLLRFWQQSKPWLATFAIFSLLWVTPLRRLSKDSEILNWNQLGTYFESLQRSIRAAINANAYLGSDSDLTLTWLAVVGACAIGAIALWRWKENKFRLSSDPRIFLVLLLFGAVATNLAQVHLTKTPYLQARLALFYWPLFTLSLASGAAWVYERFGLKKAWFVMVPLLLILLINNGRTLNLRSSFEWYHDSDTFTILEYLKKLHIAEGRSEPYSFETEWFMQNSFMYHLEKGNYGYDKYVKQVPFHGPRPPQKDTDFYYAVNHDTVKDVLDVYDIILRVPNSSLILLRKK